MNPVHIVLQGEVGVFRGIDKDEGILQTSTPDTCSVVVMHSKKYKIAVLTHIDDYTSVTDTFNKIKEILKNKFQTTITACEFKANIFGGTKQAHSVKQQQLVSKILQLFQIKDQIADIPKAEATGAQIAINATSGKLSILKGDQRNLRLEYLQQREYHDFNEYLDLAFTGVKGDCIPFFQNKEATRLATDIPAFEMRDLTKKTIDLLGVMEDLNQFSLPIRAKRNIAHDYTAEAVAKVWDEMRTSIEKEVHAHESEKKACEEPKGPEGQLLKLIKEQGSGQKLLLRIFEKRDFNLLLRQSCIDEKCFPITEFLIKHQAECQIDLNSKGGKSGSALEIATKSNNKQAVTLITETILNAALEDYIFNI